MKVHTFALYSTIFIYSILYDCRLIMIYSAILAVYMLLGMFQPNTKYHSIRRKIMIASWDEPREGPILANIEIDMTDVLSKLQKYKLVWTNKGSRN